MTTCKWLPEVLDYPDWNNYVEYENMLYSIFKIEIINATLLFREKRVEIRWYPIENNKEEAFYHCICKDYNNTKDRSPDPERMIRIGWIAPIIRNYNCSDTCCDEKPLFWRKYVQKSKRYRYHLYFRRFLVVLEERGTYYLLITAFYVDKNQYDKSLRKDAQKAENAISNDSVT